MMRFVFDHHALLYMWEQFPRNIVNDLWDIFLESCNNGTVVSHREAQKLFEQNALELESIEWSRKNSSIFKPTTTAEAEVLGEMMSEKAFEFLTFPSIVQRRIPEAIPFILCLAKKQDRIYVYRKNANKEVFNKISKICNEYGITFMEVEDCLISLKATQ